MDDECARTPEAMPLRLRMPQGDAPAKDEREARRIRSSLIDLEGGQFAMGSEDDDVVADDNEGPVRAVNVNPFRIAATTVTNADFEKFARRSGYVTDAERYGWSFVFHLFASGLDDTSIRGTAAGTPWWVAVNGLFAIKGVAGV